jgi:hypothetical protein
MIKSLHQDLLNFSKQNNWVFFWRKGFMDFIDPIIFMIQSAFYISLHEEYYIDEELATFMIQVAFENSWYFYEELNDIYDELDKINETVHIQFPQISLAFEKAKPAIFQLGNLTKQNVQNTMNIYTNEHNRINNQHEDTSKIYTDSFSKIYDFIEILKPAAAALLIHKYITQDYSGDYESKYFQLNRIYSKSGYALSSSYEILNQAKSMSREITLMIDQLDDYIFKNY